MLPYFTDDLRQRRRASRTASAGTPPQAVDRAREQVAAAIGAEAREIVFTSGATEANNLAIKGACRRPEAQGQPPGHGRVRAQGGARPAEAAGARGLGADVVPCDAHGLVSADAIAGAMTDRTVLVSVMAANNEVGTLNPIREIGRLCHDAGILFHTDATQAVGKVPLDVQADEIDLLSLSAHKIYGPKGVGALYVPPPRSRRCGSTPCSTAAATSAGCGAGRSPSRWSSGWATAAELADPRAAEDESARIWELRERLHAGHRRAGAGHPAQRPSDATAAGEPQPELRLRRRRGPDDGDARRGGQLGGGLHLGQSRAQPRPPGDGPRRGHGPGEPAVRAGPVHHRGGDRLRRSKPWPPRWTGCASTAPPGPPASRRGG